MAWASGIGPLPVSVGGGVATLQWWAAGREWGPPGSDGLQLGYQFNSYHLIHIQKS
jgi:hypothetical protein